MSITSIDEVWRGESLNQSADGTRTYVRKHNIYSNDPAESWSAVRTAYLAALGGTTHPDDASAYLTDFSIDRDDETREKWVGTATYEFSLEDPGEDPTARDPKIRSTSSLIIKSIVRDLNGYACTNSAGDYFDPPLEAEFPRWTHTIQWNASTYPTGIGQYRGAVNLASVTIRGETYVAERVRVMGLDVGEEDEENGVPFVPVTLVVECREADDDGFDLEPLDQGFRITSEDVQAGTLTTRTSDTVGTLTMSSALHGIVTGQFFNLHWFGGQRMAVTAGTVSGTSVPFTLGTGFALPASSTPITTIFPTLQDILVPDEDGNLARPSSPVNLNGRGKKLEFATDGPGFFLKYIITRKLDLTAFPGIT